MRIYIIGEAQSSLKSSRARWKEMAHRIGLRHAQVSHRTRRSLFRFCAQTTPRRPCAPEGRLDDTLSPQYRHKGSSGWRGMCRGRCYKSTEVSDKGKHEMGFAQISFEDEESEWEQKVENMRTLPSCRGPIGWFIPKRSVLSMSSRVATPWPPSSGDSNLKITQPKLPFRAT